MLDEPLSTDPPATPSPEFLPENWGPEALTRRARRSFERQAALASRRASWIEKNSGFYAQLERLLRFVVGTGRKVLYLRSQLGNTLASLEPRDGLGIELTPELVALAKARHPSLRFVAADPATVDLGETFDVVIIDQVFDTVDLAAVFDAAVRFSAPGARIVVLNYNTWWRPIFRIAERFGLKFPTLEPNWLSDTDISNFLTLAHCEELRRYSAVLLPARIPLLAPLVNRFLAPLPILNRLAMVSVHVARVRPEIPRPANVVVSVVVPCRNEEGNIPFLLKRMPPLGSRTEVIFCDDKSTDGTRAAVLSLAPTRPDLDVRLVDGPGINKAENVRAGFDAATGDLLLILDADLAVMPEELPRFVEALTSGIGEFANGSRLVYPLPDRAMKYFNLLGNKAFSIAFSYLLSQPVSDTLCGTKALWRSDWNRMKAFQGDLGVKDHWGDYDLLFGASRLQLKIVEIPVHYQERVFGTTKMVRVFKNGLHMLHICWGALMRYRLRYF